MAESFEAHITIDKKYSYKLDRLLEYFLSIKWKFSAIDGDPILGAGSKCYLTAHDTNQVVLKERMDYVVMVLSQYDIPYIRLKIEHIIFDTATNIDNLSG